MKIGVISDTHDLLREEVKINLKGCDAILHAGDHCNNIVRSQLQKIAPVHSVLGNCDYYLAGDLPEDLLIELDHVKIYMIHDENRICRDISEADIVITGHTHKYMCYENNGRTYLNPGSCGPKSFRGGVTMAYLETDGKGGFKVSMVDLLKDAAGVCGYALIDKTLIKAVMKDIASGRAASEIATRHNISKDTAETICRMYYTHPGVDADGIMSRMGL
ncbi:MAG: metallophosphoesterase family protein [Lachnospiraceae bacterium]|nr:metallophosphoesterase family protein [Lachnospiraceae bacterium]